MKKRILSLFISILLAFASFPVSANDFSGSLNIVVEKLSDFSVADRQNLLKIVYPLLSIDGGIDILVSMVDSHKSASDSLVDEYLAEILKHTTKDDLNFALKSLKIIPKDMRKKHLDDFMNKVELPLSQENHNRVSDFLSIAYEKAPGLEKILKDDGITNGVIAKFLTAFPSVNGNKPLFRVSGNYMFYTDYISDVISNKWDLLCKVYNKKGNIKTAMDGVAEYFNNKYSFARRENIAKLFSELGICYLDSVVTFKNVVSTSDEKIQYPVLKAYFEDGKLLYKVESADKIIPNITFSDVEGWYESCVTELAYMGIVSGRGDGKFYPNDFVTREEFVKMICCAINLPEYDIEVPFNDADKNGWYYKYLKDAYGYKIINGQSIETFGVGQNISRQDAAVICNNILKNAGVKVVNDITFKDGENISFYAKASVKNLSSYGIINGDNNGNFNPKNSITRAESAKIINEIIYTISNLE